MKTGIIGLITLPPEQEGAIPTLICAGSGDRLRQVLSNFGRILRENEKEAVTRIEVMQTPAGSGTSAVMRR